MSTTGYSESGRLAVLVSILIIDLICFTSILPLFPSILDYYSKRHSTAAGETDFLYSIFQSAATQLQQVVGVLQIDRFNSVFFGGILGSLFSLLQYLSSPIFGVLSDKYGRKPLLLASILGSLASYTVWLYADSFSLFVLSRVVGGLSKGSVSIAIAIVADICPLERRGRGMALVGVAFSTAFIVGPSIGAYLISASKATSSRGVDAAKIAIAMTLLELCVAFVSLPETLAVKKEGARSESAEDSKLSQNTLPSQGHLLSRRAIDYISPAILLRFKLIEESGAGRLSELRALGYVYFLYLLIYSAMEFTLCFLTHQRFAYSAAEQGRLYVFTGLLMIAVQGGYVRRIPAGKQHVGALVGLTLAVPAFILIGSAFNQPTLYLGLALYAIASALVVPCLTAMVSSLSPETTRGASLGIFRSIGSLSRACGPVLGSSVFWLIGPTPCYLVGAFLMIVPLLLLLRLCNGVDATMEEEEENKGSASENHHKRGKKVD